MILIQYNLVQSSKKSKHCLTWESIGDGGLTCGIHQSHLDKKTYMLNISFFNMGAYG